MNIGLGIGFIVVICGAIAIGFMIAIDRCFGHPKERNRDGNKPRVGEENYWQIETPHYIPPEEAIKNPAYVRGFVSAADRKREADFKKKVCWINKVLTIACMVALVVRFIVLMAKGA